MSSELNQFDWTSNSLEETDRFASVLTRIILEEWRIHSTVVVCLDGMLGAGKTTLTRLICRHFGIDEELISSPTFSLQNVYTLEFEQESVSINHFDFYRIRDEDELFETGIEEIISGPGIHIVEWSNRFSELLPHEKLQLDIVQLGQSQRKFCFQSNSPQVALKLRHELNSND